MEKIEQVMDIYRKVGRKYIPFGVGCDMSRLPEGIYAVYKTRSGSACCNIDFYGHNSYRLAKVGEIPDIDLSIIAGLEKRWIDVVTDAINDSIGENLTIADTARRILSAIMNEKAREDGK